MRRWVCAVSVGVAISLGAEARAEPPIASDARAGARELGEKGDAAFGAGRCDKAIDFWQKADAIFHAPTLLLRIARCEALLGQVVAATESLERIVSEELPANAPPTWADARAQASSELPTVRGRIAHVDIRIKGAGAAAPSIAIDDEALPIGEHQRRLDPGPHRIVVAIGESSSERRLTLGDGEERAIDLAISVEAARPRTRLQRNTGIAVGALGLAALGVGIGFGISALSLSSQLDDACGKNRRDCAPSEQPSIDKVSSRSLVADFAIGGGAALALTGGLLFFTDSSSKKSEPKVRVQLAQTTVFER
jgi:hypothetical protein